MKNLKIFSVQEHMLFLTIFFFNIILINPIFGQELNEVTSTLTPNEFNGDYFDNEISIVLCNNSNETVFFSLEPFYCRSKADSIIFYLINKGGRFCPNEILFFNKNSKVLEGSGVLCTSFSKFPRILSLNSDTKTVLRIRLDKENIIVLKKNIWKVEYDLRYAKKSELNNELVDKSETIKQEFNNSIFYKDTVNIDLKLNFNPENSLLFYKTLSWENSLYFKETPYDLIMKLFWYPPFYK